MKSLTPRRLILAGLIFGLLAGIFTPVVSTANAQEGGGQALEIAPPVLNLTGNPGESVEAEIILRDVSDSQLIVTNQINDFVADGEDGTPKLLLDGDTDSPYSMKSWISPISELLLEPRTLTRLPVTVNIPSNAAPGGYFSVIRFTGTAPQVEGSGVGLSASLGALVFMNVKGDAKAEMSIEEFFTNASGSRTSIFQAAPIDFTVRMKNSGNTFEQPRGQVTITDMFGQKVGVVNVNLPPRTVLPGSIRKFDQSLDSGVIGDKMLFGMYTAEIKMTYGPDKTEVTKTVTFWVIPYVLIGIILAILVLGFFGFRFLIRRYNAAIINKATGNTKPKRSSKKRRK